MAEVPQLSVLLPVRNAARYVSAAIQSILDQTLHEFELVLVDDGSDDDSYDIASGFAERDKRIRLFRGPATGLVAALNFGLAQVRGELVARMDADDLALPDRLRVQTAFLLKHPGVGMVGGNAILIDSWDRKLAPLRYPASDGALRKLLSRQNAFIHPSVVIRRSVLDAVGGYRAEFVHAEDYELWLRIAKITELANLTEPVLLYRVHPQQVSVQNLEQQVASATRARLAHGLQVSAPSDTKMHDAVARAVASHAVVLGYLGQFAEGCVLLEEVSGRYQRGALSRSVRAQVAVTRAWLELRRRSPRGTAVYGMRALIADPGYVLRAMVRIVSGG